MHSSTDLKDIKTDAPGYYKNPQSGAIINKDDHALKIYKKKKENNRKLKNLENDVIDLKKDLSDIKLLLVQLVEKNGNS